jgi:putative membrane protein
LRAGVHTGYDRAMSDHDITADEALREDLARQRLDLAREREKLSRSTNELAVERTELARRRNAYAEIRTRLAAMRTHLANRRTFLAWTRTTVGLMGFGFVLEKLEVALAGGKGPGALEMGVLATGCFALGALLMVLAWIRFMRVRRAVAEGHGGPGGAGEPFPWAEALVFLAVLAVAVFCFVATRAYIPL